ncbi:MAG TPA: ChaB family protein [Casimicrobiaceae bacterium]|nr:ChaB family protein [Casimicrobiaceae bacterium]
MPRTSTGTKERTEIPSTIERSDAHAQRLWKKAHDSAVGTYGEGGRAHRVAFAALKHEYEKRGDRWVRKAHKGPSDPQAARGPTTRRESTDEPRAPTAGGKIAKTASEARRKAKEARSESARARRKRTASKSRASVSRRSGRKK